VLYGSSKLKRSGHVQKALGVPNPEAVPGAHSGQDLGIASVDMKKIFEGYFKTKQAEDQINAARNAAKKELEDRMDVAKRALDAVKALDAQLAGSSLSATARTAKTKERATKAAELQNMDREIR